MFRIFRLFIISACLSTVFCAFARAVENRYLVNFPPGRDLPPLPESKSPEHEDPANSVSQSKLTTVNLTLYQAVERALKHAPAIKAADWDISIARQDVRIADSAKLPSLSLKGMAKDSNLNERWMVLGDIGQLLSDIANDSAAVFGVGAEVPIYLGGTLPAMSRIARAGQQAAQLRKSAVIQQTIFNVIDAYLDILVNSNAVKLENHKFVHKMEEIDVAREKAIERFGLQQQVLALELDANKIRQDRLKFRNALKIAQNRLLNELGLPSATPLDISPRIELKELDFALPQIIKKARKNNIQLRLLLERIRAAKERIGLAEAEERPKINLLWDYYHTRPFSRPENSSDNWEVKLQGTFKLFDGGRSRQKRTKSINTLKRMETEISSARQQVELRTRQAWAQYMEAKRLLKSLDDNIRLAKEMLRYTSERVAAHVLLKTALLKARVDLFEAQQAKFSVQAALLKARASLFLAMGELVQDKIGGV